MTYRSLAPCFAACAALLAAGYDHALAATPRGPLPAMSRAGGLAHRHKATTPIQHIVIIIQENRSFDNLFQGYPGANTQSYGYNTKHKKIKLKPKHILTKVPAVHHDLTAYLDDYDNGLNDGWEIDNANKTFPYSYLYQSDVQPYWTMANQYVLDDNSFASNLDQSFVSHQFLIAGQSNMEVDLPSTVWNCTGGPGDVIYQLTAQRTYGDQVPVCQDYQTLGDELDNAGLTWRFYAAPTSQKDDGSEWSAYAAVNHIRNGPDWAKDVITPNTQFLTDVSSPTNPYLANVTWITPDFNNSDHQGETTNGGPSWVASVVDAVGESQFWNTTAIIVLWDDWGGWYDHVVPPQLDVDGLGYRVPFICISPYAHDGVVDHTQYEFGSVLRFAENNWGLGQLAASDTRATPVDSGCMNYSQAPRQFVPISGSYDMKYFLHQRPSYKPVDDDD